jgi:hypothetical protein
MPDAALDPCDAPAGIAFIPRAVEVFGCCSKLDDEVARQVLRLRFSTLFAPQAHEGGLVAAHNGAGVRAADEGAAIELTAYRLARLHSNLPFATMLIRMNIAI